MLDFRVVDLDLSISFGNINQASPSGLLLTASLQHPLLPSANLGHSLGNAGQRTHCVSSPQLYPQLPGGSASWVPGVLLQSFPGMDTEQGKGVWTRELGLGEGPALLLTGCMALSTSLSHLGPQFPHL